MPFYWASIAGADPEPVEVLEENGVYKVLTCGCPDPFYLGDSKAGVVLFQEINRPVHYETREQREERARRYEASVETHGWRGPR